MKTLKRTILNNHIFVAPIVRFKALPPTSLYSQPLQFVPWIVSDQCLSCLCYTMSLCDISNNNCGDDDDGCGRFKITKDYWVDSGKHTIRNWLPQSDDSYVSCVSDFDCTIQSVQSYMVKFQQVKIRTGLRRYCKFVISTGL